MTRGLYLIGGPGTGKSTLMAELLTELPPLGEHVTIHQTRNAKSGKMIALRGHWLEDGGLYLGKMRPEFPGSDGLDRICGPTGVDWFKEYTKPGCELPPYVIGEGATLCTKAFMDAFSAATDLLVIELTAPERVRAERYRLRGSNQDPQFTRAGVTRAANMAKWLRQCGQPVLTIDTSDPTQCRAARLDALLHIERY